MKYFFGVLEQNGKLWKIIANSRREAHNKRSKILKEQQIVIVNKQQEERVIPITQVVNVTHVLPGSKWNVPSFNLPWTNRGEAIKPVKVHQVEINAKSSNP